KGGRSFLTDLEIENLPYATALFPYMQTVRFFADYLNGDTYFKVQYPEHNLDRARNQLRLLQCVEEATPRLEAFIREQLG
ncbi:MAG: aminoglycoside phosphotransferase, partial [Bacteroidaceae bacterium]|nr:aminoglycoside phosphotransferase [Bacteroidaceae bacterium]